MQRRGWQGHLSIATSSSTCPRLIGGWASWPEAGQSHPPTAGPAQPLPLQGKGNRLGLSVRPTIVDNTDSFI